MTFLMFSFICLMIIYVSIVIPGSQSSNFPLHDCLTDEMDVLFLYTHPTVSDARNIPRTDFMGYIRDHFHQSTINLHFLQHIISSPNTETTTTTRVMHAAVCDTFSVDNPNVEVSSWYFQAFNGIEKSSDFDPPFGVNCDLEKNTPYLTVYTILEDKIKLIQRLFSEMFGVRKNVTHIAVLYLDGEELSYEESRNIPHIVQQHQNDIKIFTVVFRNKNDQVTIHLNDTLLLSLNDINLNKDIVSMAICHQCIQGWFPFVHSYSTDYLSCYKVLNNSFKTMSWIDALGICQWNGVQVLAALETQEELEFVQTQLYEYIKEYAVTQFNDTHNLSQFSDQVYIGLQRDLTSMTKRFQWTLQEDVPYRPLVVNNWMSGKPSGGRDIACGLWKFVWEGYKNDTNYSSGIYIVDDGWVDIECSSLSGKLLLCEKLLPRRLDGQKLMIINPATNESLTKALSKGYFMKIVADIVSVSTQVGNTHFITFLNEVNGHVFPLFDCGEDAGNTRYVSYAQVCNYIDDCSNKRDESLCMLPPRGDECAKQEWTNMCRSIVCEDGLCLPLQYVVDGEVDCFTYSFIESKLVNDEHLILLQSLYKLVTNCTFLCDLDQCVPLDKLNDNHTDCTGIDGQMDETIGKLETVNTCMDPYGQFIWGPRCVYVKDMYGGIIGCRDLSHLQNCTDFECPEGYFKCPQSYCIPIHYVLDGKIDCPTGEDEQNDNIVSCTGNFACWNSKICVHPDQVCDGHADCPHQDDELDCKVPCREGFICVTWGVMVSGYNRSSPLVNLDFINSSTRYLDLSGVDLSDLKFLDNSSRLENVISVKLSQSEIISLSYLLPFLSRKVQTIDISYNLIEIFNYSVSQYPALENIRYLNLSYNKELVDVKCLQFKSLEILDLSHTGLSYLNVCVFQSLPNIQHLNLSFTSIYEFPKFLFPSNLILRSLDLQGLPMLNVYEDLFSGLTIGQYLHTNNFEMCCPQIRGVNIPSHTCHAPEEAISSCFYLIGENVQRVLLWFVAVLAVVGNATVIVYRVIWDRSVLRTGYGLFVTNLGISDFIMGVYLFIIAGADYNYRDVYVLYDKNWRESNVCRLAGFLAALSCETSAYFVFFITLDRFLVMKFPFGQIQFSYNNKIIAVISSWIIGFLLALIPIVFKFEINSSNAMCLGLPLTTQRLTGWQYLFGVFIVHNFVMFIIIAYGQRAIFKAMSSNRISGSTSSRWVQDILVAKQLFLVALSNFLCWFPIGIMGLLSLGEHEINIDVYAWATVIIIPLNSATNPVMYTIPALMAKWEQFKHGNRKPHPSTQSTVQVNTPHV